MNKNIKKQMASLCVAMAIMILLPITIVANLTILEEGAVLVDRITVDTSRLRNSNLLYKSISIFSDGTKIIETSEVISSFVYYEYIIFEDGTTQLIRYNEYVEFNNVGPEQRTTISSQGTRVETIRHTIQGRNPNNMNVWENSVWDHEVGVAWNSNNRTSSITRMLCINITQGFTQRDNRNGDAIGRAGNRSWARYVNMATANRIHINYTVDINGRLTHTRNNNA